MKRMQQTAIGDSDNQGLHINVKLQYLVFGKILKLPIYYL
jgi:hypothetical protein